MPAGRFAGSVARRTQTPAAALRTATVVELLAPSTDEATEVTTGWQVRLDFGGGDVRNAGVAGAYNPIKGDVVAVASYLGRLFVVDRVTAGGGDQAPGERVALAYTTTAGVYATTVATEVAVAALTTAPLLLRDGAAYEVLWRTGYSTSAAASYVGLRLRQDSITGTDLGEMFRQPTTVGGVIFGASGRLLVANATGVDLVVSLVPTLAGAAAVTANLFATLATRAYVEVNLKGPAFRYPHAALVTVPADL